MEGSCEAASFRDNDTQACICIEELFGDMRQAEKCSSFSNESSAYALERFAHHLGRHVDNLPGCLHDLVGNLKVSSIVSPSCDAACMSAIAQIILPGVWPSWNETQLETQGPVASVVTAARWRVANLPLSGTSDEGECRAEMQGWANSICEDSPWMAYNCVCSNAHALTPHPVGYIRRCTCIPDPSGWFALLEKTFAAYVIFVFGSACYMYISRTGCIGRQRF